MEPRIGPVTERHGLLFVLQEVLDVAHLMVHGDQVVHGDHCALFDPGDTGEIKQTKKKQILHPARFHMCTAATGDMDCANS